MGRVAAWLTLLSALGSGGCTADSATLVVDLQTDIVPRAEFASIEVTLADRGLRTQRRDATEVDAWDLGVRVAEFTELPPGQYPVSIRLTRDDRTTVLEQGTIVSVASGTRFEVLRFTLTRSCREVSCPPPSAPQRTACYGGRCVVPECVGEGNCEAGCVDASDCAAPVAACAEARCRERACLYLQRSEYACGPGTRCAPEEGCVQENPSEWDAGVVVDASGPMDAGVPPSDAEPQMDAGAPTCAHDGTGSSLTLQETTEAIQEALAEARERCNEGATLCGLRLTAYAVSPCAPSIQSIDTEIRSELDDGQGTELTFTPSMTDDVLGAVFPFDPSLRDAIRAEFPYSFDQLAEASHEEPCQGCTTRVDTAVLLDAAGVTLLVRRKQVTHD